MTLAKWGFAILLASPLAIPLAVSAQSQDSSQSSQDSLAAAARRAREEKKDAPKAAKVWDNDNIPSTPGTVSVVGGSGDNSNSAPSDQNAAPDQQQGQQEQPAADASANAPAPLDDKEKAAKQGELDADRQQMESLKKDIDILQRKLALDQQMYYIKPDYASDKAGAAALKDEQDQIDAKQQQLADLQKKVDELQSQISAAGSSNANSSGTPPATNQNQ